METTTTRSGCVANSFHASSTSALGDDAMPGEKFQGALTVISLHFQHAVLERATGTTGRPQLLAKRGERIPQRTGGADRHRSRAREKVLPHRALRRALERFGS